MVMRCGPRASNAVMCLAKKWGSYFSRFFRCRCTVAMFCLHRSAISRAVNPAVNIMSHSGCLETSQPTMNTKLLHNTRLVEEHFRI